MVRPDRTRPQISTTKGTGGDLIVLEEAAYVDPGFFYVSFFFLRIPVAYL